MLGKLAASGCLNAESRERKLKRCLFVPVPYSGSSPVVPAIFHSHRAHPSSAFRGCFVGATVRIPYSLLRRLPKLRGVYLEPRHPTHDHFIHELDDRSVTWIAGTKGEGC